MPATKLFACPAAIAVRQELVRVLDARGFDSSSRKDITLMMEAADPIGALVGAFVPSPPRAGAVWTAFVETVTELRAGRAGWPAELERARLWYEPHLDRIHENSGTRHADLIQLEQIANGYPSRERFLTELRSIRPMRRVIRQACRCSTRTI